VLSPLLLIANARRVPRHQREFQWLVQQLKATHAVVVHLTEHAGHAEALARDAAHDFPIIAAAGGDGTVSEVASGMLTVCADAVLLTVPLGTGNDLARDLGIRSATEAITALHGGYERRIDAIEISCQHRGATVTRYSIQTAGVGLGAAVVHRTSDRIKRVFGSRGAYSVGLFLTLATYRAPRLRFQSASHRFDQHMLFVSIGNAEWTGGGTMRISPGARLDDGQFDVCVFDTTSKLRVVACFAHILRGTHLGLPEVTYFPADELAIDSDPPAELMIDGEAFGTTPATFRLRPARLRVLAR